MYRHFLSEEQLQKLVPSQLPPTIKAREALFMEFSTHKCVDIVELKMFLDGKKDFFTYRTGKRTDVRYDWSVFYGTKSYAEIWDMVGEELSSMAPASRELTLEEEFDML